MSSKSKRPSFAKFKADSLKDSTVKAEYDALDMEFALMSQIIAARKMRRLSQAEVAKRLKTKQPLRPLKHCE